MNSSCTAQYDSSDRISVLIVDIDDAPYRSRVSALDGQGFSLTFVPSVDEALPILAEEVAVDLVIAGSSESSRRLRASGYDKAILLLVDQDDTDALHAAVDAPVDHFVPTHTTVAFLAASLRNAVCNNRNAVVGGRSSETEKTVRRLFERATEILPLSVTIVSFAGKVLFANSHALRLFDVSTLKELHNLSVPLVWANPKDREDWVETLRREGSIYNREVEMVTTSGKHLWLLASGMIVDYQGQPAILTIHNEVTERKIAEELVRQSEKWFRSLANASESVIFIYIDNRYVYVNDAITRVTGYTRAEFLAFETVWAIIHPDHREIARHNAIARQQGVDAPSSFEIKVLCKDRSAKWLDVSVGTIEWEGRIAVIGTGFDVTGRHEALERVHKLLDEKELILKEAHHRVKNNMMIISNLLSLQAEQVAGTPGEDALRDAAGRAQTMMVLYDKLYRSGGVETLRLDEFVSSLVSEILALFYNGEDISLSIDVEKIEIDSRTLSYLGIIINELTTNSMKYGFTSSGAGRITVTARTEVGGLVLVYRDDGSGFDSTKTIEQSETFGLQMINVLTDQLDGSFSIDETDDGAQFTLRVPLER
jgi:PAS domain S-box-containing protein